MKFFLDRVSKLPPSSRNTIASWTTPTDLLCHPFLNEFGIFLNYTCALRFNDKPNYSYLNYTCALRFNDKPDYSYFNYTRALCFDDKPDYSYLHKLFHDLFVQEGYRTTMYLTGVSSKEPKMTKQQDPAPKQAAQEGARLFKRVTSIALVIECEHCTGPN